VVLAALGQGAKTLQPLPAFFEQDATDAYERSLPDAPSQAGLLPGS